MAFDPKTRNSLQRFVNDARRETDRILRDTLAHYTASGDTMANGDRCQSETGRAEPKNLSNGLLGLA